MKFLIDCHGDDGSLFASWTIIRERPAVLVIYDSVIQTKRGVPECDTWTRRYETADALHQLLGDGIPVVRRSNNEAFLGFQDDLTYTPESRYETADALHQLLGDGIPVVRRSNNEAFLGFQDDLTYTPEMISAAIATHVMQQLETVTDIWAPAFEEGGHEQHNLVALACDVFEGTCNVHRYLTYTRAGGKSTGRSYNVANNDHEIDPRVVEVQPPSGEAIARKLRALACFKSQMQLDPRLGTAEWFYGNDLREYILLPAKSGRDA